MTTAPAPNPILVVGSLNADLVIRTERIPGPGETVHGHDFTTMPGGKSANQAAAAGNLGARVTMIGAVGNDAHGTMLLRSLTAKGVDISGIHKFEDTPTGVAIITVEESGQNNIVIDAGTNGLIWPNTIVENRKLFEGVSVVCLCLEIPEVAVKAAAEEGQRHDATVILNLSPYAEVSPELIAATDIILVNEHECAQFLGGTAVPPPDAPNDAWLPVLDAFVEIGIPQAVITLGSDGSVVLDSTAEEKVHRIPARKVVAVDTTGTGDAFFGAFAFRIAQGDLIQTAAKYASVTASIAATRHGAQPSYPTAKEVATIIAEDVALQPSEDA